MAIIAIASRYSSWNGIKLYRFTSQRIRSHVKLLPNGRLGHFMNQSMDRLACSLRLGAFRSLGYFAAPGMSNQASGQYSCILTREVLILKSDLIQLIPHSGDPRKSFQALCTREGQYIIPVPCPTTVVPSLSPIFILAPIVFADHKALALKNRESGSNSVFI